MSSTVPAMAEEPSRPDLSVAISPDDDHVVVVLSGEIDLSNADDLTATILAATSGTDGLILIDIADVAFVDSSFLGAIILCQQRLAADGIDVKVRNAPAQARRVFEITNLTHLLD